MHDYDNEEKVQSDWCQSVQNGRTTPLHSSYLEVRGQFKTIRLEVSTFLGEETFGSAYKGVCGNQPCAIKVFKPDRVPVEKFKSECDLHYKIKHPQIVQYFDTALHPLTGWPMMAMELLDESLTELLGRSQQGLFLSVQVDICHDISLALDYLHSIEVMHRDLSSNNVMVIAGRRAKLTDFGMAKLFDFNNPQTRISDIRCIGPYLPPETLTKPHAYSYKVDCFSVGVLIIQVIIQLLPSPGDATQPATETGILELIPEVERR